MEVHGLRLHHLDEELVADGHRVVSPDLVGFGRSDKPSGQFTELAPAEG